MPEVATIPSANPLIATDESGSYTVAASHACSYRHEYAPYTKESAYSTNHARTTCNYYASE